MNWDEYFLSILRVVASKSQDKSRQYGAVVVDQDYCIRQTGYNGLPRGITYRAKHHARPDKYMYFIHAEQNAIFQAARIGVSLEGCTMYVIHPPCADCAKAIIQAGIAMIKYAERDTFKDTDAASIDDWRMTVAAAEELLGEAGVAVVEARP
jgi:dCMP deaminase